MRSTPKVPEWEQIAEKIARYVEAVRDTDERPVRQGHTDQLRLGAVESPPLLYPPEKLPPLAPGGKPRNNFV